jgi:thymidine phosphorylase
MQALVEAARDNLLTDDDVAQLATVLAESGTQLPLDSRAADLASTGGISSLSTLVCPLQLRVLGYSV